MKERISEDESLLSNLRWKLHAHQPDNTLAHSLLCYLYYVISRSKRIRIPVDIECDIRERRDFSAVDLLDEGWQTCCFLERPHYVRRSD